MAEFTIPKAPANAPAQKPVAKPEESPLRKQDQPIKVERQPLPKAAVSSDLKI